MLQYVILNNYIKEPFVQWKSFAKAYLSLSFLFPRHLILVHNPLKLSNYSEHPTALLHLDFPKLMDPLFFTSLFPCLNNFVHNKLQTFFKSKMLAILILLRLCMTIENTKQKRLQLPCVLSQLSAFH